MVWEQNILTSGFQHRLESENKLWIGRKNFKKLYSLGDLSNNSCTNLTNPKVITNK